MQLSSGKIEDGIGSADNTHLPLSNQPLLEAEMTTPRLPAGSQDKQCSIDGCPTKCYAKNLCEKHYARNRIHGNPNTLLVKSGEGTSIKSRFWSRVAVTANPDRCWEWQAKIDKNGYGSATHGINGRRYQTAHRVAYCLYYGIDPNKLFVCHTCDNRKCCNPAHLYLGTRQDNMNDAVDRKRMTCGEKHHLSKFTETQVREIRALWAFGLTTNELKDMYDCSWSMCSNIIKYVSWKYVA